MLINFFWEIIMNKCNCVCDQVCSYPKDSTECKYTLEQINKKFLSDIIATKSMQRFNDVDIEQLNDNELAWTAKIIVREYRASLERIKIFN